MPAPILATKLHIPLLRQKAVLRPRLVDRLNEGLHQEQGFGRKLTLIFAPAGFGKTTLVSEWLTASYYPTAWLSLDESDNELQRFLIYFVAALQTVEQDIGKDVLVAFQTSKLPSYKPLLEILLNEIASVSNDFILVLDDYHTVESQLVDQVITFLLEHLPPQMHLVIASREDPTLPYPACVFGANSLSCARLTFVLPLQKQRIFSTG